MVNGRMDYDMDTVSVSKMWGVATAENGGMENNMVWEFLRANGDRYEGCFVGGRIMALACFGNDAGMCLWDIRREVWRKVWACFVLRREGGETRIIRVIL